MKLNQLRHFVAVAQRGSLQSSAEALGVSQEVLTRSIRGLEQELGTPLFVRTRTSMTLTAAGKIFSRRATAAQGELDRATDEVSKGHATSADKVAIGMSADAHLPFLSKVLEYSRDNLAAVRLRIVEAPFLKCERELREGVLDFYVGPIPRNHRLEGLEIEKLYDVARVVVGRKGHAYAHAGSLAELTGAGWIAGSREELDRLFEQHRAARPNIVLEVDTQLSMLVAAAAGDALLILSASWLPLIEQTGLLAPLRLEQSLEPASVHMVTRGRSSLTPAAACLHDLIVGLAPAVSPVADTS